MEWYHYFSAFWSGMFIANFIPHFVKGVCGDPFPTPFAKPPGQGLSSPVINVAWSFVSLIGGYILFRVGKVSMDNTMSLVAFTAGLYCLGFAISVRFTTKHKE